MFGYGGADRLCAEHGDDVVRAGPGDDNISSANGADELTGDDGSDYFSAIGGDDTIYAADGVQDEAIYCGALYHIDGTGPDPDDRDVVYADPSDPVVDEDPSDDLHEDCEVVHRAAAPPAAP